VARPLPEDDTLCGSNQPPDPHTLALALDCHDFNCVQMALNAGLTRMEFGVQTKAVPMPQGNFETMALPVANRKNLGVIAMKVFGQDWLQGKTPVEKLIYYSMSLPMSAAVIGMPKREHVERNAVPAWNFAPLAQDEIRRISGRSPTSIRRRWRRSSATISTRDIPRNCSPSQDSGSQTRMSR
jgi:hypothetical protein